MIVGRLCPNGMPAAQNRAIATFRRYHCVGTATLCV
jgi:hypothetical protein